jgi:hypothetical protein
MTQKEMEERDLKKKRVIGLILGAIMLFSTLGYMVMDFLGNKPETENYNGIKFTKENSVWLFSLNKLSFQTTFTPSQTENVTNSVKLSIGDYSNKPLYFAVDSEYGFSQEGRQEILINLQYVIMKQNLACLGENCSEDYPIKNCENDKVIIFKDSNTNKTSVTSDRNCVIIESAPGEALLGADAFLFSILDIQ